VARLDSVSAYAFLSGRVFGTVYVVSCVYAPSALRAVRSHAVLTRTRPNYIIPSAERGSPSPITHMDSVRSERQPCCIDACLIPFAQSTPLLASTEPATDFQLAHAPAECGQSRQSSGVFDRDSDPALLPTRFPVHLSRILSPSTLHPLLHSARHRLASGHRATLAVQRLDQDPDLLASRFARKVRYIPFAAHLDPPGSLPPPLLSALHHRSFSSYFKRLQSE
jgi:hypothetical protein